MKLKKLVTLGIFAFVLVFTVSFVGALEKGEIVISEKSKVYHTIPECSRAKKIAEKNKKVVNVEEKELISQGYHICTECKAKKKAITGAQQELKKAVVLEANETEIAVVKEVEDTEKEVKEVMALDVGCKTSNKKCPHCIARIKKEVAVSPVIEKVTIEKKDDQKPNEDKKPDILKVATEK